jgi:hypothetical protein
MIGLTTARAESLALATELKSMATPLARHIGSVHPRVAPASIPSLGNHVNDVLNLSADKQVVRSYARRVVALVENAESAWNWAVVQRPREPRCTCASPVHAEDTVAVFIARATPIPTSFGLDHVIPESSDGLVAVWTSAAFRPTVLTQSRAEAATPRFSVKRRLFDASFTRTLFAFPDNKELWLSSVAARARLSSSKTISGNRLLKPTGAPTMPISFGGVREHGPFANHTPGEIFYRSNHASILACNNDARLRITRA